MSSLYIETMETIMSIPIEARLNLSEYPFFLRYLANSKDDIQVTL